MPSNQRGDILTVEELHEAERYCLKVTQNESFLEEITALKMIQKCPKADVCHLFTLFSTHMGSFVMVEEELR